LYPSLLRQTWDSETRDTFQAIQHRDSDENTPLLNVVEDQGVEPKIPGDSELIALLHQLELGHLVDSPTPVVTACDTLVPFHDNQRSLDAVREWAVVLSSGEQQRIAFARLLVHKWAASFPLPGSLYRELLWFLVIADLTLRFLTKLAAVWTLTRSENVTSCASEPE
jgi:hypothetical protein